MKLHLPVLLRKALLACFSFTFACTCSAAAAHLTLGDDDSLIIDYADADSIPNLENGTLRLNGDTILHLSNCGEGDGKTYTLLTGVSALRDDEGNVLSLDSSNNAVSLYFDTTKPGVGFWADATLLLTSDGALQLVRYTDISVPTGYQEVPADDVTDIESYSSPATNVAFRITQDLTIDGRSSELMSYDNARSWYFTSDSLDKLASLTFSNASDTLFIVDHDEKLDFNGLKSIEFSGNTVSSSSSLAHGGAIFSFTMIELSGNGSVAFRGNSAAVGGAIYGYTIELNNNGSVTFSGNTASSSSFPDYSHPMAGSAIYGSTIELNNNGSVTFSGNKIFSDVTALGGAINGSTKLSGNGSVEFIGNTATASDWAYGGAINGSTKLSGNEIVQFSGNTASSSSSYSVASGGAIYGGNDNTITLSDNGSVEFNGNTATASDWAAGGAIYGGNDNTITLSDNGIVLFRGNTASDSSYTYLEDRCYAYGGAIYGDGNSTIELRGNGSVEFIGNSVSSDSYDASGGAIYGGNDNTITLSDNGSVEFIGNSVSADFFDARGGAIYADRGSTLTLNGNDSVTFSENSADYGGAIYGYASEIYGYASAITLSGNDSVTFSGNEAYSCGGAICAGVGNTLTLNGNDSVTFSGNEAYYYGGAIFAGIGSTLTLNGNDSVTFSGNEATASDWAYVGGGAIYADSGSTITLSGNDSVEFNGNSSAIVVSSGMATESQMLLNNNGNVSFVGNTGRGAIEMTIELPNAPIAVPWRLMLCDNASVEFRGNTRSYDASGGGAISGAGYLSICNNGAVLFEKNAVISRSNYCLRSINIGGGSGDTISLSAAEGKNIEFRDSVYIASGSTVDLNGDYTDESGVVHKQTGDIIFTGKYTEQHLNELLAADGLERTATVDEILNSRITEVQAMTNLYGGRLIIEDGAIYKGYGMTVHENSNATVRVKDATLLHAGYDLTFNAGTVLELKGQNSMSGNLALHTDSTLSIHVDSSHQDNAALTLTGALTLGDTVTLCLTVDDRPTSGQAYKLLTGISQPDSWNPSIVQVTSGTPGWSVDFNDLSWVDNTLWLNYNNQPDLTIATWTNESGNRLWDDASVNWEQNDYDYAYKDGVQVIFGDEGSGTVTLVGALSPASVLVNSSEDYIWKADATAGGSLTGSMKLTKEGSGMLTINMSNSYSGGTVISGGRLTAGSDTAFGTGDVELRGGMLELNRKALENKLLAQGGIISGGSGFRGAVVFNGAVGLRGNLSASAVTINQGSILTLNGSTISVSGSLTLAGDAVLNLNGSAFGAGDVLITFGSLSGSEELLTVDYGADSDKYTVEREGNSLILAWLEETQPEEEPQPEPLPPTKPEIPAPVLDRESCDALVQSSWGVFTASHAFADAIGGQRSAAGYVGGGRSTAWVSALGGLHRIDGSTAASGSDIDLYGAAVGLEHFMTELDSVGFAVGNVCGDVKLKQSGRETEQTGMYVGVYGTHLLAGFDRSNWLSLKWSAVYGDTTTEGAVGQEEMSWKQDSVQLNARAEWTSQLNYKWALSVFGGVEYFASDSAENESGDSLRGRVTEEEERVRMGSIQNLRGELGIGTRYTDGSTTLYGEVRYLNDMVRSNPYADINGLRGYGANPGRQGIGLTVGAQQELGDGWSVSAGYSLEAMSEATMHSANIGAGLRF